MVRIRTTLAAVAVLWALAPSGCASEGEADGHEWHAAEHGGESTGEHARDRGGSHDEMGEESGTELALDDRYDSVRHGVRLILAYDEQSNSFKGTVVNVTDETLRRVRVEVHLSNGTELGPTTPADLGPGRKRDIELTATKMGFDGWTAHPEVGSSEHADEHGGEHR